MQCQRFHGIDSIHMWNAVFFNFHYGERFLFRLVWVELQLLLPIVCQQLEQLTTLQDF